MKRLREILAQEGLKTAAGHKIPASFSKLLGKHEEVFVDWLESQESRFDLAAKGSFKKEDGAYIIDLPGDGALDEFAAGHNEADDIITNVISKMIGVPVKTLQALSFDDFSQTSRGWYVYLPSKR